jgi:hypothetical protein
MRRLSRLYLVGPLFLLLGNAGGFAADPPEGPQSVWGPIEYDAAQGSAASIDKVISVAFDNFLIENQGGEHGLVERKLLGANFPLSLGSAGAVTELKASLRGAFVGDGEASGTLVVLIGSEQKSFRFPNEEATDDGGNFLLSLDTTERFPNGTSVPVTILLVAQKAMIEDSVLLTIDTLDIAVATE